MLLGLVLAGCGGAEPAPPVPPKAEVADTEVARYLPLPNDFVYTYDTYSDGQRIGSLWIQVSHVRDERVDLKIGSRVTHLELAREGVRDIGGGWVLKAPLKVGAEFAGKNGRVRITQMDVAIETAAGSFKGCLETQEEAGGAEAQSRVTTLYCPDVGITRIDIMTQEGNELVEERAVLRSFNKRVDINSLGDEPLPETN
ncbi:MAG: hypothetical protein H6718_09460 [Polyangiaceae bacterium]|nr:hypothetical protein [Polyangiaceae bacterium]MCB9606371.1 hypothetical protein [Polyangiaceae bacterium]